MFWKSFPLLGYLRENMSWLRTCPQNSWRQFISYILIINASLFSNHHYIVANLIMIQKRKHYLQKLYKLNQAKFRYVYPNQIILSMNIWLLILMWIGTLMVRTHYLDILCIRWYSEYLMTNFLLIMSLAYQCARYICNVCSSCSLFHFSFSAG